MKLASFRHRGRDRVGFESGGSLVAFDDLARGARVGVPPNDMIELIEQSHAQLFQAARGMLGSDPGAVPTIDPAEVEWHPPVRRPSKILGIALNNSASDDRKISAPDHPLFFMKPASSLVGHRAEIVVHDYYGSVHPEPELAVVSGRECRQVKAENAFDVVFGYSIFNDMTGNAMRAEDRVHY
jgi:2,4-didehydro-3-deoxy-L-rhamnonate hydrolase